MRLLFLFLATITVCWAQTPVRVVTWNLQWFPGKSRTSTPEKSTAHIAEVRKALAEMRPDVLVLQEVSGEAPVVEALSELPDFKVAVISRFKTAGLIGGQQVAICSRFPATRVFSASWDRGWAGAPRGFAYAALDCGGGAVLNIYGVHLKSNLGDAKGNSSKQEDAMINTAKREDAIEQLIKHQKEMQALDTTATRWLVCGDFNTSDTNAEIPSERTFPLLVQEGFYWTFDGVPFKERITCPAKGRYPDACFDQIFVKGLGKPVASPLRKFGGSDHLPVSVDLDLPAPWATDADLHAADSLILKEFAEAKERQQKNKMSDADYLMILGNLRSKELELLAAVRKHEFKDLTESNYWHRGRLKFPGSIEMEMKHVRDKPAVISAPDNKRTTTTAEP